jgi:hypothetical protein
MCNSNLCLNYKTEIYFRRFRTRYTVHTVPCGKGAGREWGGWGGGRGLDPVALGGFYTHNIKQTLEEPGKGELSTHILARDALSIEAVEADNIKTKSRHSIFFYTVCTVNAALCNKV